jgi:hypothetical protein
VILCSIAVTDRWDPLPDHLIGRTHRSGPLPPLVDPNQIEVGSLPTRVIATAPPSASCLCTAHASSSPTSAPHDSPSCVSCLCAPHSSYNLTLALHMTRVVDKPRAPLVIFTSPVWPLLTPSVPVAPVLPTPDLWCRHRSSLRWSSLRGSYPLQPGAARRSSLCRLHLRTSFILQHRAGPPSSGPRNGAGFEVGSSVPQCVGRPYQPNSGGPTSSMH